LIVCGCSIPGFVVRDEIQIAPIDEGCGMDFLPVENEIRDRRFESFDGRPATAKKGRSPQQQRGSDRLA
jgi:hypothetical protein